MVVERFFVSGIDRSIEISCSEIKFLSPFQLFFSYIFVIKFENKI